MGSYVKTGDLETWFEEHAQGDGSTVVLLHGGMCTAATWGAQIEALSDGRRLLVPERRGHGHTADPGEISYDLMADDTVAFLEAVAGGPADLVGWSDGGIVGLLVALRRPDLVNKLVLIGTNFHHEGTLPEFFEGMDDPMSDGLATLRVPYEEASPDGPEHWPVVMGKLLEMWKTSPTLTVEDLRTIDVPTLVLVGDDDAMSLAHTVELFESLPQGQLAVVPGSSHLVPIEKPALVNQLVNDFLADGSITSFLPIRRRNAANPT